AAHYPFSKPATTTDCVARLRRSQQPFRLICRCSVLDSPAFQYQKNPVPKQHRVSRYIKPFRTQSCLAAYFTWPQVAITHHVSNKESSEYRFLRQPYLNAKTPVVTVTGMGL